MTAIKVLRPDVEGTESQAVALAPRGELPEQLVIGLIANGKPLANELLGALADGLRRRLGRSAEVVLLKKPSAGYPITGAQGDGMAARAHFVITGVGD